MASTDPREGESRAVSSRGNQSVNGSTVTLGLIPAPEIPEKIARDLAAELPELLDKRVDASVSCDVSFFVDPLTGSERDAPEILDVCRDRREQEGWDMAVCMTDLPIYRNGHLVVADVSASRRVAGLSLPALGALRLRSRAREAILQGSLIHPIITSSGAGLGGCLTISALHPKTFRTQPTPLSS